MRFVNWVWANNDWAIPLVITFLFSVINIIFAIINAKNAVAQNKAQQVSISISLMQRRMDCYCVERSVLESIIDYQKPSQKQLEDLCHVELESSFLFGDEIKEHIKAVIDLTERILNHKKTRIPDAEGGFFESLQDYDEEMFSQEASCLYGASIDLYGKYIDFSNIGVMDKKRRCNSDRKSERLN